MKKTELDIPALLIDGDIMLDNVHRVQAYTNQYKVHLRPHTKTNTSFCSLS